MQDEAAARAAVLAAAQGMLSHGLSSGTSGNVSARLGDGRIVITPSQRPYPELGAGDLVVITPDGELAGPAAAGRVPSSETQLHCACYQAFPEIGGIVHSHPPFATMFAAARQPVPAAIDEAVLFLGGDIPVAGYAPSGSARVGQNAVQLLADRASALLASHGMVSIAASPAQALHCAVISEHCAQVAWGARALGGPATLPASTVQAFGRAYLQARRSAHS